MLHTTTTINNNKTRFSQANYRDESTLPARITQHCRLLAASKTANKPPAAATGDGGHSVRSFPATPESSGAILDDGHGYVKASAPGSLSSFGRRTSSNFVLGPLPDPTARASQLAGAGGRGGAGGGRDSAGSGTVPYVLASDGTGSVRGNIASVRVPLSAMATTAAAAGHASVLAGDGNQGLNRSLAFSPLGAPTMGNCQQQQQKGQREGIAGVEEMSGNGMVMQRRETFLVSDDNSRGEGIASMFLFVFSRVGLGLLFQAFTMLLYAPLLCRRCVWLKRPRSWQTPERASSCALDGQAGRRCFWRQL